VSLSSLEHQKLHVYLCLWLVSSLLTCSFILNFHIRATRVIATVKSSQIVFLLVLLLESGIKKLLRDRVDSFRLEYGLKLMAVLGRLGQY